MKDTNVTQKIETPAEKVARLEAELRQAREAAEAAEPFREGGDVLVKGRIIEVDKVEPCYRIDTEARGVFWTFSQSLCNPADFIPRAEHERLVEEARREDWKPISERHSPGFLLQAAIDSMQTGKWKELSNDNVALAQQFIAAATQPHPTTPQDCEQEPVGYANRYKHGWTSPNQDKKLVRAAADSDALEIAVPLYRRPAPLTEQAKLAAGDCVDCLIKEYALDNPTGGNPRPYTRDHEGIKYTVTVSRTCDSVAPARAVAPKGVVEEIKRLLYAHSDFDYASDSVKAEFESALSRVTELPEASSACYTKAFSDAYCSEYALHMASAYYNRYLALLAAANPAKEGEE